MHIHSRLPRGIIVPPANNLFPPALTATGEAHTGGVPIVLASCPNLELGLTGVLSKASRAGLPPALPAECYLSLPGCLHYTAAAGVLNTVILRDRLFRRPGFFSSGTRTRTEGLVVMSHARYQLLYPAIKLYAFDIALPALPRQDLLERGADL